MADNELRTLQRAWRADPTVSARTRLALACMRAGVPPPDDTQPPPLTAMIDLLNSRVQDSGLRTIGLANVAGGLARHGLDGAARSLLERIAVAASPQETAFPGLAVMGHGRIAAALLRLGEADRAHAHVERALDVASTLLAADDSQHDEDAHDASRSLIDLVLVAALAARRGAPLPAKTLDAIVSALSRGRIERTIHNLYHLVPAHLDALVDAGLLGRIRPIASGLLSGRSRVRRIFLQDAIEVVAALAPERIDRRAAKRLMRRFETREDGSGIDEHAIRPLSRLLRAFGDPLAEAQGLAKRLAVGRRYGGWIAQLAALRAMAEAADPRLDEALMEDCLKRAWRMPGDDVLRMRVVTRLLDLALGVSSSPDTQHRWLSSALEQARTMTPYAREEVEAVIMSLASRIERGSTLTERVLVDACERVHARSAGEGEAPCAGIEAVGRGMLCLAGYPANTKTELVAAGVRAARDVLSAVPGHDEPRHFFGVQALFAAIRALGLSAAADVRLEALAEVSWAQGTDLDDLVADALSIAQEAEPDERETWVVEVLDAVGVALARPIRTSRQHAVAWMRAAQERQVATSLTSSVAELLDPGHSSG